jgi:hypothetical protein
MGIKPVFCFAIQTSDSHANKEKRSIMSWVSLLITSSNLHATLAISCPALLFGYPPGHSSVPPDNQLRIVANILVVVIDVHIVERPLSLFGTLNTPENSFVEVEVLAES